MSSESKRHFRICWNRMNYTIEKKPTSNYGRAREGIKQILASTAKIVTYSPKSGSYDVDAAKRSDLEIGRAGQEKEVEILQNLNGSFRSGQLTAVMGPSGAGKTSLLNFLCRRQHRGFSGNLTIAHQSGQPRRLVVSAIPQNDHLPEYLSVRENLTFACKFKNPSDGRADREKNVQRVSNLLGLDDCLDTRTSRISGGQQKRLAIAQELLSRPDILILDEPTSGLDSLTCLRTLSVLKDLTRASAKGLIEPIAIVLTIHQPDLESLALFDKLYVLASGGVAIYDGPPDRCGEFVDKYSCGPKVPAGYNPASFLIDIASGEFGIEPIEALESQMQQHFAASAAGAQIQSSSGLVEISRGLFMDPNLVNGRSVSSGGHFFYRKTRALVDRCTRSMLRHPNLVLFRILLHLFLPLGVFLMMGREPGEANACPKFSNEYQLQQLVSSDNDKQEEEYLLVFENVLSLYNVIYPCISVKIALMSLTFILDMKSSLKEFNNGWYSIHSYVFARFIADLPLDLILPTVSIALTYWITGQATGVEGGHMSVVYRIIITSCAVALSASVGQMMGFTFGAIYLDDVSTALFMSQAAIMPFVLLSGILVSTRNMFWLFRWLSEVSIFKHCLEIAFIARYGFGICRCNATDSFVGSANVNMTGIPDDFRTFTKFYINSQIDNAVGDNLTTTTTTTNSQDEDIFQLIAKQLSLYNTYGVEVQSCKDVIPYEMRLMGLEDGGIISGFKGLFGLQLTTLVVLLLTLKVLLTYRSSL